MSGGKPDVCRDFPRAWHVTLREMSLMCSPPVRREHAPAIALLDTFFKHKFRYESDLWRDGVSDAVDFLRDQREVYMPHCFARCQWVACTA